MKQEEMDTQEEETGLTEKDQENGKEVADNASEVVDNDVDDTESDAEEVERKKNQQEQQPDRKVKKCVYFALELLAYIAVILLIAVAIPKYVLQRTLVDGSSMENNLMNNDNLLVEKISPHINNLDRFDVVVFYPNYDEEKSENSYFYDLKMTCMRLFKMDTSDLEATRDPYYQQYYVKRIIGLPGETIQIKGSDIYINDELLEEDYGKMAITNAGIAENPIKLGEDEYFVMGDNRKISLDSRYEEVGPVKKEQIAGKAVLRIWPFKKFGLIK